MLCVRRFTPGLIIVLGFAVPSQNAVRGAGGVGETAESRFTSRDTNADRELALDEFSPEKSARAIRDFRVFDWDQNGVLSAREFAAIPNVEEDSQRGDLPDPFAQVLEHAIAALDDSYDGWNHRPDELADSTNFAMNFRMSVTGDSERVLDHVMVLQADQNRDRRVSRSEAIRFLEIQLGIRWQTDDLLRFDDGRAVHFARFIQLDSNRDGILSRAEFISRLRQRDSQKRAFDELDQDASDSVSIQEFANRESGDLADPIVAFLKSDANLDGLLDGDELRDSVESQRQHLVDSNLRAFDEDDDGRLSMVEYRRSMLACFNYPWETRPLDENRDGRLTFLEFRFHERSLFQLQRRYFFHKLDRNADGGLTIDEFPFLQNPLYSIHRVTPDGDGLVELFRDNRFPIVGSPSVSHDGRKILFEATPPEGRRQSVVVLMSINGEDARVLCDGAMPSWSADGRNFVCTRYEGGSGIWIMNLDGTAERRIDTGSGACWSPDGKRIAYIRENSLRLYDVDSEQSKIMLAADRHPYEDLFPNIAWSPSGQQIVVKGKLANDRAEIAIFNIDGGASLRSRYLGPAEMATDFEWSADGKWIFFNRFSDYHDRDLIYRLDPDSDERPAIFTKADTKSEWKSIGRSPDGRWLVLGSANAR